MKRQTEEDDSWSPVSFFIPGIPKPTPRPRRVKLKTGVMITYQPKDPTWTQAIQWFASQNRPASLLTGPLRLSLSFALPKPRSKAKRITWPSVKPDWDNLGKAVCDALTGVIWRDDSLICDVRLVKLYGDRPGCMVTIEALRHGGIDEG